MFILRAIGILIALAMAGAAVLAIIYGSAIWTFIWASGSVVFGAISLSGRKKKDSQHDKG